MLVRLRTAATTSDGWDALFRAERQNADCRLGPVSTASIMSGPIILSRFCRGHSSIAQLCALIVVETEGEAEWHNKPGDKA
jgi:hypothetical protein